MDKSKLKKRFENAAFCVFVRVPVVIFCGACFFFGSAVGDYKQNRRRRKPNKEVEHEAMIVSWPRPLAQPKRSPTGLWKPRSKQHGLPSQGFGFLRLPAELRIAIYSLILEMQHVRVIAEPRSVPFNRPRQYELKSYWSHVPSDLDYRIHASRRLYTGGCVIGYTQKDLWYALRNIGKYGLGIMNLLLTCRELCEDVLSALHNNVTFIMNSVYTLHLFSRAILPTHFNAIRSLHLDYRRIPLKSSFTASISHFPKTYKAKFSHLPPSALSGSNDGLPDIWNATCSVLAQMQGLKKLRIQLCHSEFYDAIIGVTYYPRGAYLVDEYIETFGTLKPVSWHPLFRTKDEGFVFEPLLGVARKDMEVFEVEVDWPSGDEGWDERQTEFRIVRVGPIVRG